MEDVNLSPAERTRRVIHGTMQEIENFLKFTMETSEDFESGWLATLDTVLCVTEGNKIEYIYYEKPVSSNVIVQKLTAMEENSRMKTLANELTRRVLNTSEALGVEEHVKVIDKYIQKLINSGYALEQVRKIIINGIKGYERRLKEGNSGGRSLHRTTE